MMDQGKHCWINWGTLINIWKKGHRQDSWPVTPCAALIVNSCHDYNIFVLRVRFLIPQSYGQLFFPFLSMNSSNNFQPGEHCTTILALPSTVTMNGRVETHLCKKFAFHLNHHTWLNLHPVIPLSSLPSAMMAPIHPFYSFYFLIKLLNLPLHPSLIHSSPKPRYIDLIFFWFYWNRKIFCKFWNTRWFPWNMAIHVQHVSIGCLCPILSSGSRYY